MKRKPDVNSISEATAASKETIATTGSETGAGASGPDDDEYLSAQGIAYAEAGDLLGPNAPSLVDDDDPESNATEEHMA